MTVPTRPAPLATSLNQPWHTFSVEEVAQQFDTNTSSGQTAAAVQSRQEQFGPNELTAKPGKPAWLRFILQFNQPLLYILILAHLDNLRR
jgi:Ca2+-transporting ATPase